jgi:tartrate dehydrogenase/decarboxylase/D-malate dehydrogenase
MLDHLGLTASAAAVRNAVASVLKEGTTMPPDLGGKAKTTEVAGAVLAVL